MNPIAQTIQKERLRKGITEKALAKKCGLAESYIRQVEAGKKVINEKAAEKILKTLGVEPDVLYQGLHQPVSEEPKKAASVPASNHSAPTSLPVEPNDQWAGALAHIIKRFPVKQLSTGKVVDYEELPVLGKKIDGCPWEKVHFFQVDDSHLQHQRITRNDRVMVCETNEVTNGKLYVVEMDGRRLIRQLWKEPNHLISVGMGQTGETREQFPASRIRLIGRCVKVIFYC